MYCGIFHDILNNEGSVSLEIRSAIKIRSAKHAFIAGSLNLLDWIPISVTKQTRRTTLTIIPNNNIDILA